MVNLELYRVFYSVAQCGSLTKAAETLFISQPAVSQAIKQLENQLGTPLFNRTHHGMELTKQGGELIFKQVERALGLLEEAENRLAELKTSPTGSIRIGASDTIFSYILAEKIVEYNEKYPAVRFEMLMGTSVDTIEQLRAGKIDIGFLNLPVEHEDVEVSRSVQELNDVFLVGEKFSFLRGRRVDLVELKEYPLLMLEKNTIARRALDTFSKGLGVELVPDMEVGSWDFMKKLAASGIGIACLPREYAKKEMEEGTLFEIDVSPALPVRGVGIAYPKNVNKSFALKKFIELFE
ncbi:MAG: LysR family transcriptional regulator [Christensenellaceae bacterium]